MEHKTVSVIGSTGSIGRQALEVISALDFDVEALAAGSDIKKLEEQIRTFHPRFAAVADEKAAAELKLNVADTSTKILSGENGICESAAFDGADIVLNAVVGIAGLRPTMAAIGAKKTLALANKETLVAGGEIVMREAALNGVSILPVDSEHSAIFQCLQTRHGNFADEVSKIILTASGGPFYGKTREELEQVSAAQALCHPNWSMGSKITIDSSTLMNKGLELIEACRLFGVPPQDIEIVVQRQSIIHSAVEFTDGAVIAQLGAPDMRVPIQYALTYPLRTKSPANRLDLFKCGALTFERPDTITFKCLAVCMEAAKRGGLFPAAVNGANERAVALFLNGKIGFNDIGDLVSEALTLSLPGEYTLDTVFEADMKARELVSRLANVM